jgi:DNA-binding transcriptional LysR family regulator
VLRDGLADVSFVRLPADRTGLSVIPLYEETFVVVVPRDHPVSAFERVSVADLAAEERVSAALSSEDAVGLVAAGGGILILPQSLARLHTRKDVVARPVTDLPTSTIAIAWMEDRTTAQVEEFVGIVRGRTAASSRTVPTPKLAKAPKTPKPPRPAPHNARGARAGRTRKPGGR